MADTYLRVLGKPELIVAGKRIESFRTWRLWGVIAYVALSTEPVPRAVLARTFWPDVDDPRANLKVALRDLRSRAGQDIFHEQNECLSLLPGFHSDMQELRRYTSKARQLTDPKQKRCYLEAAATLARDEFLVGSSGDWVVQRRGELFLECRALYSELLSLQLALGERADCVTTARELLRYDPDNAIATMLLLQFDKPDTVKEQATARQLIQARLRHWKAPGRAMLYSLATFPGPFRSHQAEAIAGLTHDDLCNAVSAGLVQECPQGFELPDPVRQDFWRRLTGGERRRFRRRFATWFIADLLARSPLAQTYPFLQQSESEVRETSTDLSAYLRRERENLKATLEICREEPEVENALLFLCALWEIVPERRNALARHYEIIERAVPEDLHEGLKHYAYTTVAMMSSGDSRLEPHFYEYLERYELEATGGHWPRTTRFEAVLSFFHHKGHDATFDEILARRLRLLRQCPEEVLTPQSHYVIAENSMARHRFAHALLHNQHCLEHWREQGTPDPLGKACLQRGIILRGMELNQEARALWNEAMEHFELSENPHGTGTCLLKLADLHRVSGALSEAQLLLEQSILFLTRAEDIPAIHAAEGILGDVYRDRGQWEKARPYYEKGLAFWSARNHHRWTASFEQRLKSLPDPE